MGKLLIAACFAFLALGVNAAEIPSANEESVGPNITICAQKVLNNWLSIKNVPHGLEQMNYQDKEDECNDFKQTRRRVFQKFNDCNGFEEHAIEENIKLVAESDRQLRAYLRRRRTMDICTSLSGEVSVSKEEVTKRDKETCREDYIRMLSDIKLPEDFNTISKQEKFYACEEVLEKEASIEIQGCHEYEQIMLLEDASKEQKESIRKSMDAINECFDHNDNVME